MQQKPREDTYTHKQTTWHNNKKLDLEQNKLFNTCVAFLCALAHSLVTSIPWE